MFDHLDDPEGFAPDHRFRARARARGRARRRRLLLARTGAASVAALALLAGLAVATVDRRLDRVERVDVATLAPEPAADGEPFTVLVVGTDRDAGLAADDPVRQGREGTDPATARSDTMVLVRVQPAEDLLTVLPLPRDLWVEVPGHGGSRANSALARGGPALLVQTVRTDLGIEVDRYVELDLRGAMDIGDALGGLRLAFGAPVRDRFAGLALEAGCRSLDGRQLLALARARHLEQAGPGGRWQPDPSGDLGRIERQQAIGLAALASLARLDATDPGQLTALLDVASRDLTVDGGTSNAELVALVRAVAGSEVVPLRIPVVDAVHDGASVLERGAGSDQVLAAFRAGGTGPGTGAGPGAAGPPAPSAGAIVPVSC